MLGYSLTGCVLSLNQSGGAIGWFRYKDTGMEAMALAVAFSLLYRKFLLNHELCKQIALQKQGTENRRLRLEDIKTFFSKIVIVDIIKFM